MQDKTIQEFKRNFINIFHEQVFQNLKIFEKERLHAQKEAEKYSNRVAMIVYPLIVIMVAPIGIPLIIFFMFILGKTVFSFLFGLLGLFISGFICFKLSQACIGLIKSQHVVQKRNLEESIKTKIMDLILPAFGNLKWVKEYDIDNNLIVNSKITDNFDNIFNDDVFVGTYKNVEIVLIETSLLNLQSSNDLKFVLNNENHYKKFNISKEAYIKTIKECLSKKYLKYSVFNGILISIKVPKRFSGHTVVVPSNSKNYTKYNEVKLEDVEFLKQFKVYSTDQVEARYLLTPSVMERLKNIQNKFNGKNISCSFKDNSLLIAIPTDKDLFSLGNLDTPVTDTKQYNTFLEELISIFEIIEELKLYENTGL